MLGFGIGFRKIPAWSLGSFVISVVCAEAIAACIRLWLNGRASKLFLLGVP